MKLNFLCFVMIFGLFATLIGCQKESETLLNKEEDTVNEEGKVIFGEKKGDRELQAKNVFSVEEDAHFIISRKENFNSSTVTIIINKNKENGWDKVTSSKLEVKNNWNEVMNGLPSSFLKKVGTGAYQLVAKLDNEVIARGEFIVEESK